MANPNTVVPFDQFAPDAGTLTPSAYADALAVLDVSTYFAAGTDGLFTLNPGADLPGVALFPFSVPDSAIIRLRLDVGQAQAGSLDQYVACFCIDKDANLLWTAKAGAATQMRDSFTVPQAGNCCLVFRLGWADAKRKIVTWDSNGGLARATTGAAHGLSNSDTALLIDASEPSYLGSFAVQSVTATTFTIPVTAATAAGGIWGSPAAKLQCALGCSYRLG